MNLRLRTVLVAGLLLAAVNFCGPAARSVSLRAETCITWIDCSRCDQSEISEPRQRAAQVPCQRSLRIAADDLSEITVLLDRALFQRPPPSLPRS